MSNRTKTISTQNQNSLATPPRVNPMGRGNPMGMMGVIQKPKNFKKTMRQLGAYIKPFWLSITIVIIYVSLSLKNFFT